MLNAENRERLVELIEGYVYDLIEQQLKEDDFDIDSINKYVKNSIHEWLFEGEDELNEDVISDTAVIEEMVDEIINELLEACKKESDDCDSDDEKDDCEKDDYEKDDDSDDEMDESASMVKHKISKIQSVLDKRKRETDPKYKMSRRRTLMKMAARGGRVVNKKLSKSLKKSFNQGYGKRWESKEDIFNIEDGISSIFESDCKNDVEGDDVTPEKDNKKKLAKKMSEKAKEQKEAIEESMREVLKSVPSFGTLNEEESNTLSESFISLLSENVDKAVVSITESLLDEMEDYKNTVIIPSYNNKVNQYLSEEVIPSMEADVDDYLDYVVNEKLDEIMESGKIYKSRDSIQLESFRDKLLNLIEENLYIVPEQEDALIAMEKRCESLTESLKTANVEKIKSRNKAVQLENELWIEKNIPDDLSDAGEEKLRLQLEDIEYTTHDEFVKKANRIINESESNSNLKINEQHETVPSKKDETDDIVTRTLNFMKHK